MSEPAGRANHRHGAGPTATGRHRLLLNATELLRQPGTVRSISTSVAQADVDVHEPRLHGDITIELQLTSTLDDIEVVGTLTVDWSDECRRCLTPLAGPLMVEVEERYAPVSDDPGRTVDPEAFPIERGQLDLAPDGPRGGAARCARRPALPRRLRRHLPRVRRRPRRRSLRVRTRGARRALGRARPAPR